MCGRFVQYSDPENYASRYHLEDICEAPPRWNLAPTQPLLAIRMEQGRRRLVPLRWGLIPSWSKGPDSRYSMINARAETVHEKPAYRAAFRQRRCLIPSEGFYEWRKIGSAKQPYLIRVQGDEPFCMAGLWEQWHDPAANAPLESCSIIVTAANPYIRPLHDRMPVILPEQSHAAWLDPSNSDTAALRELLALADTTRFTHHPVDKAVNNARNDHAGLIAPIANHTGPPQKTG